MTRPRLFTPARAVVIGTSTGGPDALDAILSDLPPSFPAPILVVQHLPEHVGSSLVARLDKACLLRVREAEHTEVLHRGYVYVAPAGFHLRVARCGSTTLATLDREPEIGGCRPAVDALFESAAAVYGEETLGVVLTGLGRDGVAGSRAIRHAGGQVLVQDEATSAVWGMPGAVARANLASAQIPLLSLATAMQVRTRTQTWPANWPRDHRQVA